MYKDKGLEMWHVKWHNAEPLGTYSSLHAQKPFFQELHHCRANELDRGLWGRAGLIINRLMLGLGVVLPMVFQAELEAHVKSQLMKNYQGST